EPRARLYVLRHRARHGPHRPPLRSGDRHGAGHGHRRRPHLRAPARSADRRSLFRGALRGGAMRLLDLSAVVAGYGAAPVLNGVSIAIDREDIGVIVGPNGAGKSTTLKAIFGLLPVASGAISFNGADITNMRADRLVPM